MLVVEAKLKNGTPEQYHRLDEAIRTSQFVRNSCVRYWMDNKGTTRNDLQKLCAVLANNKETPWGLFVTLYAKSTDKMPRQHTSNPKIPKVSKAIASPFY